jgi:SulP family sulfate permease
MKLLPFLTWPRLTRETARADLLAGVTVASVAIPQSVAYASLAGMPLVTGLYACLLPSLVGTLWGSAPRIATGPVALTSILTMSSLSTLAIPGSSEWVQYALWLAILAGVIQLVLGALRGTWLFNLISLPVLHGFTQAATLLIIVSQIPHLLGTTGLRMGSNSLQVGSLNLHTASAAFGVSALAALLLCRRVVPRFPAIAIAAAIGAVVSWCVNLESLGGAIVGTLPAGLPVLGFPATITGSEMLRLMPTAVTIACISFVETMSSARPDSAIMSNAWNAPQEAIAQGLAKIASGISGAFPVSTSFSRSALNRYAGAQSTWATLFAVAFVALFVAFAIESMRTIPMAVLAAIIITPLLPMLAVQLWLQLWKVSRTDCCIGFVTLATTLMFAPAIHWGVALGVTLTLLKYMWSNLHPRIIEVGRHTDGSLRDRERFTLPVLIDGCFAVRVDAALDFVSAASVEAFIVKHMRRTTSLRCICLFASGINSIDATGHATLNAICERANSAGIAVVLCALKAQPEDVLRVTGLFGRADVYCTRTEDEALALVRKLVG